MLHTLTLTLSQRERELQKTFYLAIIAFAADATNFL